MAYLSPIDTKCPYQALTIIKPASHKNKFPYKQQLYLVYQYFIYVTMSLSTPQMTGNP